MLFHHVANAELNCTVTLGSENVWLLAGANVKFPLTMSRVEEKPTTVTVTPPEVCWNVTLLMNGTPALVTMVFVVDPRSPLASFKSVVSVMVPAVVPVRTVTGREKLGAPAGILKLI